MVAVIVVAVVAEGRDVVQDVVRDVVDDKANGDCQKRRSSSSSLESPVSIWV